MWRTKSWVIKSENKQHQTKQNRNEMVKCKGKGRKIGIETKSRRRVPKK